MVITYVCDILRRRLEGQAAHVDGEGGAAAVPAVPAGAVAAARAEPAARAGPAEPADEPAATA